MFGSFRNGEDRKLHLKVNPEKIKVMDNLFEQFANISKASAYDIIVQQNTELKEENGKLKDRVKYLEDLIREYAFKMKVNLSGGKVDEFLKNQSSNPDDLGTLFTDHQKQ